MKYFLLSALLSLVILPAYAQTPPSSFNQAKKFLADLHEEIGHMKTIYCGCKYERTTASGGKVDRTSCGLKARTNETRSKRVEWEHVVPASWFGQTRACWKLKEEAYPNMCAGKSGRQCCEKVNDHFDLAHNDPNNLFPSSGEVNGDRSNHPYGMVEEEKRVYGSCNFEMGRSSTGKVAEPGDGALRGVLARAMLYMSQVYGVDSKLKLETVWEWHVNNPPEEWEITRAKLIAERTGLKNEWILGKE
jgi:deoxyribonuclease-1